MAAVGGWGLQVLRVAAAAVAVMHTARQAAALARAGKVLPAAMARAVAAAVAAVAVAVAQAQSAQMALCLAQRGQRVGRVQPVQSAAFRLHMPLAAAAAPAVVAQTARRATQTQGTVDRQVTAKAVPGPLAAAAL
jgi:hypothetical protein